MTLKFRFRQFVFLGVAAVLFSAGCATPVVTDHRLVRYRPLVGQGAPEFVASSTNQLVDVSSAEPEAPPEVPVGESVEGSVSNTVASVTDKIHGSLRSLASGDRVVIYLRGIPQPEEIKDIIDGFGEITLPYIGEMKLVGRTTSESERLIETTYIERGIYNQINVIVVAEDEAYFVQGEVARQGKFPLSGAVTLLQAITEAGGYTPFANRKKIKVIRGSDVAFYNAKDIAAGRDPDPAIESDDIVEVLRKW
jgi:hypothetical protein